MHPHVARRALDQPHRAAPFDHLDWLFEPKFDGSGRGRLISRKGHRMQRFEGALDLPPRGRVFDGELVGLADGAYRTPEGRHRRTVIGRYELMTPEQARQAAWEILSAVAKDIGSA